MRVLSEFASSTYTGTGAAVSVNIGFKPACVIVWNETDGDVLFIHINGMTAATAIQIDAAVAALGSNGCTLATTGFTAGSSMSESAKVFRYIAF